MPGSRKDRKHARENGGIAAAVTKQAAAASTDAFSSSKSLPASDASSPRPATPDIRPSLPDSGPSPPDLDGHVASPLLDALSAASASASTAPRTAAEWPRAAIAGSPGNLINLTSESPPTQPSSYEDSARLHYGWAAQRPFMSPSPAPSSPPRGSRRPLSFQMDSPGPLSSTPSRPTPAAGRRRSLLHSQCPSSRATPHPPLPHQPQAHFCGAQDLDLTVTPHSGGMKAGDHGCFFGLDRLPSAADGLAASMTVVLAGYQGGLQVYAVGKRGVDLVASLKGLRRGVLGARILPWTVSGAGDALFPLVALVIHGAVLPPRPPDTDVEGESAASEGAVSPRHGFSPQDGLKGRPPPALVAYQTAVEVYSLRTGRPVDVLLQAPQVLINTQVSISSPLFQPPPPSGAFTVKADCSTIAVCSGVTGECWIFRQLMVPQDGHLFACAGKLWTTLQQSHRGEAVEEVDKTRPLASPPRASPQTPVFALDGRWVAYCPAAPSSQMSLRAHLPVPILGRAPGVSSMTPPHLPTVSASVDLPISDSVVNKIMRETTQELIQGAKWVGQQGMQAWNAYWNKPSGPQSQQQQLRSPPQPWAGSLPSQGDAAQFPPTHGAASQATAKEPGLVSIVDAQTLSSSASLHPLTTFATPLGCSFLSFSPSSLALFTASTKGDVQTVWDLLRIQYTHSSPLQTTLPQNDSSAPLVRQIAQFSRMTVARIVDVAWAEPRGERLAMVTERGTVHLLEMPFSAFMWPPPRRRKVARKSVAETSEASSSAVSIASGAIGAAYQAAKPFVTRSRRSSANTPAPGNTLRDSAAQGGRAIAATISHSLGKTGNAINQLRHTGENRVSLPPGAAIPSAACVTWLRGRKSQTLATVGGGLVRIFPCSRSSAVAGKRIARANRYRDVKVPLLPDDVVAPVVHQIVDMGTPEEYFDLSDVEMEAGNTMTIKSQARAAATPLYGLDATIPHAEIESSAPYHPFHTDRRVALFQYDKGGAAAELDTVSAMLANASLEDRPSSRRRKKRPDRAAMHAWAFGQDIAAVKLDVGLSTDPDDDEAGDDNDALPASAMERVMQYGQEEQIVVTTRRRRGVRQGDPDEDGFFEDDCEVLDFADQRV